MSEHSEAEKTLERMEEENKQLGEQDEESEQDPKDSDGSSDESVAEEGVQLVWDAFEDMIGGEIYVKKIQSMKIVDIASAIDPGIKHVVVGKRPGEKLHEQMISIEDSPYTYEFKKHYKIFKLKVTSKAHSFMTYPLH